MIAGPSLQRYYTEISGQSLSLKDIYQAYQAGTDPHAAATMERLFHFFGLGISTVINTLDPDVIIIGGGVGNIDMLYTRGVEAAKQFVFNPRLDTPIIKPILGDSAGVFGAAMLVP